MCGARKFSLSYISRDDLASLTREAPSERIPYMLDVDNEEVENILNGRTRSVWGIAPVRASDEIVVVGFCPTRSSGCAARILTN